MAGRSACPSELVMVTVPVYPVTVLPFVSFAVTVNDCEVPATMLVGPVTVKVLAPAVTVIPDWMPVMAAVTVSVAVMD